MKIVRGRTLIIQSVVYLDRPTIANIAGATIKATFKVNARDADADALFNIDCTIIDADAGICQAVLTAADTLTIEQNKIYFEIVAKLSDGTFIGSGIDQLEVVGNVLKTLF